MKEYKCDACGCETAVEDNYEPEYCCSGGFLSSCGCYGKPINPVLCEECENRLFGMEVENDMQNM
jgi:hypothetical protein